jgi:hypothetical protein
MHEKVIKWLNAKDMILDSNETHNLNTNETVAIKQYVKNNINKQMYDMLKTHVDDGIADYYKFLIGIDIRSMRI